jgi:hypothetical protein
MDSDKTGITCIVTIHGIGFQQPPGEGVAGYADDLHAHLCRELNQIENVLLSEVKALSNEPHFQQVELSCEMEVRQEAAEECFAQLLFRLERLGV